MDPAPRRLRKRCLVGAVFTAGILVIKAFTSQQKNAPHPLVRFTPKLINFSDVFSNVLIVHVIEQYKWNDLDSRSPSVVNVILSRFKQDSNYH